MPASNAPFRFGLKSLFTAVTAVAVHLAVHSWDQDAFVTLLPCSLLAAGMALVRRRTAEWPAALAFGITFGVVALVCSYGALMLTTVYAEFSLSGFSFKRSSDPLLDYGTRGVTFSVVISSCLVLGYSVGVPLWRIVTGHR